MLDIIYILIAIILGAIPIAIILFILATKLNILDVNSELINSIKKDILNIKIFKTYNLNQSNTKQQEYKEANKKSFFDDKTIKKIYSFFKDTKRKSKKELFDENRKKRNAEFHKKTKQKEIILNYLQENIIKS